MRPEEETQLPGVPPGGGFRSFLCRRKVYELTNTTARKRSSSDPAEYTNGTSSPRTCPSRLRTASRPFLPNGIDSIVSILRVRHRLFGTARAVKMPPIPMVATWLSQNLLIGVFHCGGIELTLWKTTHTWHTSAFKEWRAHQIQMGSLYFSRGWKLLCMRLFSPCWVFVGINKLISYNKWKRHGHWYEVLCRIDDELYSTGFHQISIKNGISRMTLQT